MNRARNRRALLVGFTTVMTGLVAALSLAAQSEGEGGMSREGAMSMKATPSHATIGTLEAVGYQDSHVVVEYPHNQAEYPGTQRPSFQSFATGPTTLVEGLGNVDEVKDITPDAWGRVVVVTFTPGSKHSTASRLTFPVVTRIRATDGTIQSIGRANKVLVLDDSKGQEQRFSLGQGSGVEIDSNQGLLDVSDLHKGQQITVYYARPQTADGSKRLSDDAYLIFQNS